MRDERLETGKYVARPFTSSGRVKGYMDPPVLVSQEAVWTECVVISYAVSQLYVSILRVYIVSRRMGQSLAIYNHTVQLELYLEAYMPTLCGLF